MKKPSKTVYLVVVMIQSLMLMSCSTNPVTGRSEITLVSVEQEKKLGAESAQKIKESMGFIDDPKLTAYIREIGNRLAVYSPYKQVNYQFNIVNLKEPNAFALPGGYVYVSRGLLALANSEDEIAGVIGHEIGHIAARHAVQRMTRSAPIGLVTGITSLATGIVSSSLAGAVSKTGEFLNSALLAPYSREQENEADQIGQELAAKAGWDPKGITLYLATLNRQQELINGQQNSFTFLSTHPATPDRVAMTEQRVGSIERRKAKPIAASHVGFLNYLNGLKLGDDADEGVFQEQLFLHPQLQFALTFPKQWKTQNDKQFVVALPDDEKAVLMLQIQENGDDPIQAGQNYLNELKLGSQLIQPKKIAGLPSAETEIYQGGQHAIINWIVLNGRIFRLTGIDNHRDFRNKQLLLNAINSFHRLTEKEKQSIRQSTLRIATTRPNETLLGLIKRTGSTWNAAYCAMANNISENASLKRGQRIKIAIAEPLPK